MKTNTVIRIINRNTGEVEVCTSAVEVGMRMLGRRYKQYIVIKSEEDERRERIRDVLVPITSPDVRYLELQLNIL
jgi:hypothetical protein